MNATANRAFRALFRLALTGAVAASMPGMLLAQSDDGASRPGGRVSIAVHWLGGRAPIGDRLAEALRAQNFDDTRQSLVSGQPREHPIPDGAGFTGMVSAAYRVTPLLSVGADYTAGVDLGSAAGYRAPEFNMETVVRAEAFAATVQLHGGAFRIGAGPALHRLETRLVSGLSSSNRTSKWGVVADAALSLPLVRGLLYTDGRLRFGWAGEVSVPPGTVRATLGTATVPFEGAAVPVRYWLAGLGLRLAL